MRGSEGPGPGPSLMQFCCLCSEEFGTAIFAYVKKKKNLGLESKVGSRDLNQEFVHLLYQQMNSNTKRVFWVLYINLVSIAL